MAINSNLQTHVYECQQARPQHLGPPTLFEQWCRPLLVPNDAIILTEYQLFLRPWSVVRLEPAISRSAVSCPTDWTN